MYPTVTSYSPLFNIHRVVDGSYLSDSDGEPDGVLSALDNHNHGQFSSVKKRPSSNAAASLFVHKPFPGVGKFQPISFLAFILLGPPAGDKCLPNLALDAHMEPAARPRLATSSSRPLRMLDGEDMNLDDLISPTRKRPRKEHHSNMLGEDENEAIRIFNAETTARAQRLEELKLALSLFPDDENIKAELKQFVDTQRRTSLSADTSHHAPLQYSPSPMSMGGMPSMSSMSNGNMAGGACKATTWAITWWATPWATICRAAICRAAICKATCPTYPLTCTARLPPRHIYFCCSLFSA
ncbi:hypothetical protein EON65_26885 [archaeon]|nr:MAG: hypothetical protein EON65_26885 [archaeon]